MSLFRKIFFPKTKSDDKQQLDLPLLDRSKYMPENNLPIDESFMINFKSNGGKFLYCDSLHEILLSFHHILGENDWFTKKACCFNIGLTHKFSNTDLAFVNDADASFFLATCEYLIADSGSILVSSNQLREKKLTELPDHFVIFASTSQLVNNIGEGMKGIKEQYNPKIPSNITTIKNFDAASKQENDFMSYGSISKNLYLLLLEDL